MERRSFLKTVDAAGITVGFTPAWSVNDAADRQGPPSGSSAAERVPEQNSPEYILLKENRPRSIYKIPGTEVHKANIPIVEMHSHPYAKTPEEVAQWVRNMDQFGVAKTIIPAGASGPEFDDIYRKYAIYPDGFQLCCGFDYTGYDQTGFDQRTIRALETCHAAGSPGLENFMIKGRAYLEGNDCFGVASGRCARTPCPSDAAGLACR
jgi:hypothetical protein